jgi:NhaP-type Na+/H+ or K+/H+ antiporter
MAFSLALIILLGLGADYLFRRLRLPGLVGMLVAGVLAGPYVWDLMSPEMMQVSGDFRQIALVVILLRAGFELRRDTLHRVGRAALIMSSVPAVFEIIGVLLVAPPLLGLTWLEATILGCILAAVSPAVVVPLMIDFMDRGMGAKKGIPTLILGASSVDDVFVIVLFSVFLGMYGGGEANLAAKLMEIPVSILLGILVGLIPGYRSRILQVQGVAGPAPSPPGGRAGAAQREQHRLEGDQGERGVGEGGRGGAGGAGHPPPVLGRVRQPPAGGRRDPFPAVQSSLPAV